MRTICVNVDLSDKKVRKILNEIAEVFICFVNVDEERGEVAISCRQEDAKAVERRLSSLV